jgi:hypothetical protein
MPFQKESVILSHSEATAEESKEALRTYFYLCELCALCG